MRRTIVVFLRALLALAPILITAPALARSVVEDRLILVGDSTIAPNGGYGDALCARFELVTCINRAKGGRSSKSYRAEGLWDEVRSLFTAFPQPKVFVLIQFGHNDQPGKGDRSTTLPEFSANMKRYVEEARNAGAIPILVTPLTRRQFKDGKVVRNLEDWAQATREVARATGAALLDLNADSTAAIERIGPTEANTLAQAPPPPEVVAAALTGTTIEAPKPAGVEPAFDYTHLGDKGAEFFASIVADEVRRTVPALAERLR
jgi:lysophospholipase L1-like esterase